MSDEPIIEVEPYAFRTFHGVRVPTDHGQLHVTVNGKRVAYCGREAGKPIIFIRGDYPEAFKAMVRDAVAAKVGEPGRMSEAPAVAKLERVKKAIEDEDTELES